MDPVAEGLILSEGNSPLSAPTETLLLTQEPKLEYPRQFLEDILRSAREAQNRIQILSLSIADDHATGLIQHEFEKAAERGIKVEMHIDSLGQMQEELARSAKQSDAPLRTNELFTRLRNSGIDVTSEAGFWERFFDVPRAAQHAKLYIIDNCAWIGGMNLTDTHFSNVDFMVKIPDEQIVRQLVEVFRKIKDGKSFQDYSVKCDSDYSVLVDGSRPGTSIIYDNAFEVVKGAKQKIVFVSQYPPNGRILQDMIANPNREVIVITSDLNTLNHKILPFRINFEQYKRATEKLGNIKTIYLNRPVHTKLIVADEREAIWGSNNYFDGQSRWLGWHELDIRTSDKRLVDQFSDFIQKSINDRGNELI